MSKINLGFDPKEIAELKKECKEENSTFIYVDDEEGDYLGEGEYAHIHFVGMRDGKEVIFDAVVYTLRLHHSSLVYEEAERRVMKIYPLFVPPENRDETYQANDEMDEEIELLIQEFIEEIEENEEVKVAEGVEEEKDFEYGIGLDVYLNVEEIDEDVLEKFVEEYTTNTLKFDPTMYSFKSDDEDMD